MKNIVVTCFGLLLATVAASPIYGQTIYEFDGGGVPNDDFFVAANWNDFLAGPDAVPGPMDQARIFNSFVVDYAQVAPHTVSGLKVGSDPAGNPGPNGTPGTLNMSDGKLNVTGGGDSFQISRACCASEGSAINMTGAELEIGGSDPIVGTRDNGVLDVGDTASVHPTAGVDNYWRLGNYGPSIDSGLEGNGLLNVHGNGSFSAHVIFIGDNDATGELRVSDNGSVVLTGNLVPRPSGFQAGGSAKVQMNGATATLSAFNLESASEVGEIPTLYEFNADPVLGVSPIVLTDAINITNNDLIVNLNGYPLALFDQLLLFDGDQALAGNRLFGTFASSALIGSVLQHRVIYDQANGDIYIRRVPEPSTLVLLGLGMVLVIGAKRRTS